MPKKKKTRKQKALSDLRQKDPDSKSKSSLSQELPMVDERPRTSTFTYALEPTKSTSAPLQAKTSFISEYSFIASDLKKTALLTITIIAMQLILYFFMNRP